MELQLTKSQREAVEHGGGPLLIVAGAGTGKTLIITHRIAHLIKSKQAKPEEILAVTFTEKAAAEMTERVDVLLPYGYANVQISTFHAFGDRLLREFGLEMGLNPDFQVLSEAEQVIFFRDHLFEFPLKKFRPLGDPTRFIQEILKVISRAKDEDVSPDAYKLAVDRLRTETGENPEESAADALERQQEIYGTYARYEELKAQSGKLDFGDQISLSLRLLREHPAVLRQVQSRYSYFLIDEFQDTNYAQFQLIRLLGGNKANITVVGDDDQSIYKFRGAAISNILGFMDLYPDAKQVVITENFRNTQVILDTAYKLISYNNPDRLEVRNRIDKRLKGRTAEGPLVEHLHCDTLETEADSVAKQIEDLIAKRKCRYSDIAILVRANRTADPFIRSLNMKEIPWRFTGNRGLYDRIEIKLLIAFLKTLTDLDDSASLFFLSSSSIYELISIPDLQKCANEARRTNRSLYEIFTNIDSIEQLSSVSAESTVKIQKIVQDLNHYMEFSRDHITGVVLYQFLMGSGYLQKLMKPGRLEDSLKVQNIARFFDVIWSFSRTAMYDRVNQFVSYLDLLIEAGDDPGIAEADADLDAVQIMTVHKAKGLEFTVVFLVCLIQSRFPSRDKSEKIALPDSLVKDIIPQGDSHLQEERRLFYVGMTRAREQLFLTSAEDYGGVRKAKVSQFVLEALDRPKIGDFIKTGAEQRIKRFAPQTDAAFPSVAPLPDDQILSLSYYQVDDYQTCPLKYKYIHILRVPILPHHAVIYGKALHAAIELYHRQRILGNTVELVDMIQAYKGAWRNIGFFSPEHEEKRYELGIDALKRFMETQNRLGIVPAYVEERFSFLIGNNRVEGRWDRIDYRDEGVVIVDFKSSDVYMQDAADKQAKNSLQLAMYAMAFEKTYSKPVHAVELHFLESGLTGRSCPTEKIYEKTEKSIVEAAEGIRKRDYTARPEYQACRYCAFLDICPSAVRY